MNEIQIVKGKIKLYGKDTGKIQELLDHYEKAKIDQEQEMQIENNTIARLEEIFNWQKKQHEKQIKHFQKDIDRKVKIIGMIKTCLPEEIIEIPKEEIEVET